MDINKQHIVLNLIRSGRYRVDFETGDVYSNVGLSERIMKPLRHYSGYLQYCLDIGFNHRIMVYGQGISFLAMYLETYDPKFVIDHKNGNKSDNRPENLRCITHAENLKDNGGHTKGKRIKRVRIPVDQRHAIREGAKLGISHVKLAEQYHTTRQTIARIVEGK